MKTTQKSSVKRRETEHQTCKVCGDDFMIPKCYKGRYRVCRKKECQRLGRFGSLNANWRGGKTKTRKLLMSRSEYKQWRKEVFERDNYTCQRCGKRGGELNANHINSWAYYPKLRYCVENGETLCLPCHQKTYAETFLVREIGADKMRILRSRKIIAYDLDGTLCNEICWTEEGCLNATPNPKVVADINSHYEDSITMIYTAREDKLISSSVTWLRKQGILYWGISNRKMHADLYIDDNCVNVKDL